MGNDYSQKDVVICPRCFEKNSSSARLCGHCGHSLAREPFWTREFWGQVFLATAAVNLCMNVVKGGWDSTAALAPAAECVIGALFLRSGKSRRRTKVVILCMFFLTGVIILPGGFGVLEDLGGGGMLLDGLMNSVMSLLIAFFLVVPLKRLGGG